MNKKSNEGWEIFNSNDDNNWEEIIQPLKGSNIFQTSHWANYKLLSGWSSEKYIFVDDRGQVDYALQVLKKTYLNFFKIYWIPGGIAAKKSVENKINDKMEKFIDNLSQNNYLQYLRINLLQNKYDEFKIEKKNFSNSNVKVNSGFTIHININKDSEEILSEMKKKHRYYVNKSLKENVNWNFNSNKKYIRDFLECYNNMILEKKIKLMYLSNDHLFLLKNNLKDKMKIITCYQKGELISSCIVLIFNNKAFYYLAVTTSKGRDLNISYAMIFKTILYLKELGIKTFDFGGINPNEKKAKGVDHFKKGFGGNIIENLGEYDWASSNIIKIIINKIILRRKGSF
jgi:lipid II:glycine glycyltransferase (peptidoglycan interpeptide bridge formation enzyme)